MMAIASRLNFPSIIRARPQNGFKLELRWPAQLLAYFVELPVLLASVDASVRLRSPPLLHRRHIRASKTGLTGVCVTPVDDLLMRSGGPWLEKPEATSKTCAAFSPR